MFRSPPVVVAAGIALSCAGSANAAAADFGYTYTAGVAEPGESEVTVWATDRRGKGEGHYDAQDYRVEVERGLSDRLQLAGYVNFAGHHVRGLSDEFEPVERDFAFQGVSAEFKYRLADPSNGRWGFALYAEPGWSRISKVKGEKSDEFELELKAIIQKNFLADRVVWAANLTLEPEWEREREPIAPGVTASRTLKELAIEATTGISMRAAPRTWIGLEARYHSVYPDWTNGLHRENYAVSAGPSVHYDAGKWALTATWLPQLFGGPSAPGSDLEVDDHEMHELRLKVSYEF